MSPPHQAGSRLRQRVTGQVTTGTRRHSVCKGCWSLAYTTTINLCASDSGSPKAEPAPLALGIHSNSCCCPSLRHRNKPFLRSCHEGWPGLATTLPAFSFTQYLPTKALGLVAVSTSPLPDFYSSPGGWGDGLFLDLNRFYSRISLLPPTTWDTGPKVLVWLPPPHSTR